MHQIDHLNLEQKWAQINDVSRGKYSVNDQIKFKTTMLRSSLCYYSDAYILVTRAGADAEARKADERDKGVIFKNCASFPNCIRKINNTNR